LHEQNRLRIIFMGTPDFAVPSLAALVEQSAAANWEVVAVATQPDRPAGRGGKMTVSPVKAYAQEQGIPLLQPESLRKDKAAVEALRELAPDLIVVAAYGLILPPTVLEIPTYGCINVHASLLPAYRGASPITAAILDGLDETGVTIMLMDEGMDTGPALAQATQEIRSDDTTASLSQRLAEQGASLLVETLPKWVAGKIAPIPQEELPGEPSICRLIRKEAGRIDWTRPAIEIERMTRAYTPWPSAYTEWRGQPFKILAASVLPASAHDKKLVPGEVARLPEGIVVGTGKGLLLLKSVQPAGKRAMTADVFVNGARDFVGSRLPN
jgi:methionyl-tRNA formyltransferase